MEIRHLIQPRLRRTRGTVLENSLCEEQKTFSAAGSPGGCAWTPFKETCKTLLEYVKIAGDGVKLNKAIKEIKHHYSVERSAIGSMKVNIEKGFVPNLRVESGKLYYISDEDMLREKEERQRIKREYDERTKRGIDAYMDLFEGKKINEI